MRKQVKYFVTFFAPGSFMAETWTVDVQSADPKAVVWPKNAYAFTLHEQEDVVDGDTRYTGSPKRVGPVYYHPDSKIETLEQVKHNPRRGPYLVSNMQDSGWDRVIWTRWGNWPQPYNPKNIQVLERQP